MVKVDKKPKKTPLARSKYRQRHQEPEKAPAPVEVVKDLYIAVITIKGEDDAYTGIYETHAQCEHAIVDFHERYGIGKESRDSKIYNKVVTIVRSVCALNQEIS